VDYDLTGSETALVVQFLNNRGDYVWNDLEGDAVFDFVFDANVQLAAAIMREANTTQTSDKDWDSLTR
jgi:hypothetical protein